MILLEVSLGNTVATCAIAYLVLHDDKVALFSATETFTIKLRAHAGIPKFPWWPSIHGYGKGSLHVVLSQGWTHVRYTDVKIGYCTSTAHVSKKTG